MNIFHLLLSLAFEIVCTAEPEVTYQQYATYFILYTEGISNSPFSVVPQMATDFPKTYAVHPKLARPDKD